MRFSCFDYFIFFSIGTLYTSFFVLGHDCGHGSFSFYPLLNDIVGTILHTWILAPYYTWKVNDRYFQLKTLILSSKQTLSRSLI